MDTEYYLTEAITRPKYNVRLLFKAPMDKKKDKKALIIITNPEDTKKAPVTNKALRLYSKTLATMKPDLIKYINESLVSNRLEPLEVEALDELHGDLINKVENGILAEEVLDGIAKTNDSFTNIYNYYLKLLNPKLDLSGDTKEDEAEETERPKTNLEKIRDFLTDNYKDKLMDIQTNKLTVDNPKQSLIIDYGDLVAYDTDLADLLLIKPEEVIKSFNIAIKTFISEETKERFKGISIKARFKNIDNDVKFKNLKSNRIGELVEITGNIKSIRKDKPKLITGVFECRNCMNLHTVDQNTKSNNLLTPNLCKCGGRSFRLLPEESIYTDLQVLTIREPLESIINNEPKEKEVIVTDELVDKARAGAEVKLTGIFTTTTDKDTDYIIEANNIELLEEEAIVKLSKEDENKILEFTKSETLLNDLVKLFAPKLILPYELKLAMLCYLVRGIIIGNRREWINILIIGDPATAKTEIKFNTNRLSNKCVMSSGTGATARGLTATTNKDKNGNWILEAGVLALADNGEAIIDEIDKAKPEDKEKLNEAIDNGFIPVNRAGFNTILPSRAGVLAFGNPKGKRFDRYKYTKDQINIEEDVISRFDLLFTLEDIPNKDKDSEIFKSLFIKLEDTDNEFLKKYLTYARKLTPEVNEDIIDHMDNYYLKYRADNTNDDVTVFTTVRQGEAIGRLSGAIAKLQLHKEVTEEDVDQAIELINFSLDNLGQLGVDKTPQEEHRELIIHLLKDNSSIDNAMDKSYLRELFKEETKTSDSTFKRRLKDLENSKAVIVKGKTVYLTIDKQ